ncbi:hypothetical protein BpHYR1_040918 [Brachionus plicatilis]|uniref:Uncharacterized protein n=1 Tax=Brachionus plicatilis TaxID=10195 RepID=A0A3M7SHQ2_BRAPC|nr:hypothetical protein BpHYR1_040918 [Brachionus plicatilis]
MKFWFGMVNLIHFEPQLREAQSSVLHAINFLITKFFLQCFTLNRRTDYSGVPDLFRIRNQDGFKASKGSLPTKKKNQRYEKFEHRFQGILNLKINSKYHLILKFYISKHNMQRISFVAILGLRISCPKIAKMSCYKNSVQI